jgi:hypothetical protein
MRGSQIGCHFYFHRVAVLVAVPIFFCSWAEWRGLCFQPALASWAVRYAHLAPEHNQAAIEKLDPVAA